MDCPALHDAAETFSDMPTSPAADEASDEVSNSPSDDADLLTSG
jgi:hypothetical protein